MIKNSKKNKKGFTLVEVIIVLAIIAIIAAIAIPNLTKVRTESKEKADMQTLQSVERTVNMLITNEDIQYSSAGGSFVITDTGIGTITGITTDGTNAVTATALADYFEGLEGPQKEGEESFTIKIDGTTGEITGEYTKAATPQP